MTRSTRRSLSEAAHKLDAAANGEGAGDPPPKRRGFNEAAHKLAYRPTHTEPVEGDVSPAGVAGPTDAQLDVVAQAGRAVLALGALGVVYGDIGTSPLYTEQTIFTQYHATRLITAGNVFGIVSLIFWALMVEVSIKYAGFIMRAAQPR